jgi:chemotaxis protein methyltransferase CheR
MQTLECRSWEAYLSRMDRDAELLREAELLMSVSISRFFRDRRLWEIIEEHIFSPLIRLASGEINVWTAGCAMGQEVYSLKILWTEYEKSIDNAPPLSIWATDVNKKTLEKAGNGIYPPSSMKNMPEEFVKNFFSITSDGLYRITDKLNKDITWEFHDLVRSPIQKTFHIIFLRNNLLTYYREDIQRLTLEKITKSLRNGGFLITGSHEKLPSETLGLSPLKICPFVFQKT